MTKDSTTESTTKADLTKETAVECNKSEWSAAAFSTTTQRHHHNHVLLTLRLCHHHHGRILLALQRHRRNAIMASRALPNAAAMRRRPRVDR